MTATMPALIDIGANLTHNAFDGDRQAVIDAALPAGLVHIIVTGTDLDSSREALALARSRAAVCSATAGFHPHVAASVDAAAMTQLQELASEDGIVAVGETGLDFNRNHSPRPTQLAVFEQHLELAAAVNKPLFLHQRDAHSAFLPLLRQYRPRLAGGVVHCFTGDERALRDYLELDMYIGVTGWICDERRGQTLQSLAASIPLERLLMETDAPYLLPRSLPRKPRRGRNEPQYLPEVLAALARCSGHAPQQLAAATTANAVRLFGLDVNP